MAVQARQPAFFATSPAEAFFFPGVRVVVVAVPFPEAELIVVEELEATDPLCALPEVTLRYEEAERVAVLALERLAAEGVGQHDVVVVQDGQREVGRVALLRVGDDVCRRWSDLGQAQDLLDGDALPIGIELGPTSDAMDVRVDCLARQLL